MVPFAPVISEKKLKFEKRTDAGNDNDKIKVITIHRKGTFGSVS